MGGLRSVRVFGCLWLRNGTKLDLDGQELASISVNSKDIVSYGEHELGREANIYIEPPGYEIRGLQNVRRLFKR